MGGVTPSKADDTLGALTEVGDTHATGGRRGAAPVLERGTAVGRYVVISRLGAGGMGVVYAAYDPGLDRRVALKLVIPEVRGASHSPEGHARLLREAQALAKLSHPNVVAIHDVGSMDDRVWLAMEFVEGQTLGAWAEQRPRPWGEVLAVMLQAGEGLVAAHAAGLLHRDFKPDNVMVDRQGQVKVMDFGLARTTQGRTEESEELASLADLEVSSSVRTQALTRAGALMGTPAYMAPEQFGHDELTAAADQFAFCIVLWELLFGERPFRAESVPALAEAVLAGRLRAPPSGVRVPGWLRRACERGLAVDPEHRHASMSALLQVLSAGQRRAGLGRVGLVAGALGAVAIGGWGWQTLREHHVAEGCRSEADARVAAWDGASSERVRAALLGTGVSFAPSTVERVIPRLDAAVTDLRDAHVEACLDARVRETWDEGTLDRSMWCLDERAMELEAIIGLLEHADEPIAHRAVSATAELMSSDPCRDANLLARRGNPPGDARERVRQLRARLSSARASARSGHLEDGLDAAEAVLADAEALAWPPLIAAARTTLGDLRSDAGDHALASDLVREGYFAATAAGEVEVASSAAITMVDIMGRGLARYDEAELWARLAEVELARLDATELDLRRVALWGIQATVLRHRGSYEEAKALHERALAVREQVLGPEHIDVAASLTNLAAVLGQLGEHEQARGLLVRALAIVEEVYGPDHPGVAKNLNNLAGIFAQEGKLEKAKAMFERSLSIAERSLGPKHPDVAGTSFNLGTLAVQSGDLERAEPLMLRGLEIAEVAYGSEHPKVAQYLQWLGSIRLRRNEPARALPVLERSLSIFEKAHGGEHFEVGYTLELVGQAQLALDDHGAARDALERAVAILEVRRDPGQVGMLRSRYFLAEANRRLGVLERARAEYERVMLDGSKEQGPAASFVARARIGLAETALSEGRPTDAAAEAERAVASLEADASAVELLAAARFVLAQASWETGDRARARVLARQSARALRGEGHGTAFLGEVESWIEAHPVAP